MYITDARKFTIFHNSSQFSTGVTKIASSSLIFVKNDSLKKKEKQKNLNNAYIICDLVRSSVISKGTFPTILNEIHSRGCGVKALVSGRNTNKN